MLMRNICKKKSAMLHTIQIMKSEKVRCPSMYCITAESLNMPFSPLKRAK